MMDIGGEAEPLDPRAELGELASAARALVEWYADAGAFGLPVEGNPDAALAAFVPSSTALHPTSGAKARAQDSSVVPMSQEPRDERPSSREPRGKAETQSPAFSRPSTPLRSGATSAFASASLPVSPKALPTSNAPLDAGEPLPQGRAPVAFHAEDRDDRRTRLAVLSEQARTCTACGLHEQRKQAVFHRGDPFAELCFVGEGPGADEDVQGEPFVGAAGQLLDKMIVAMGFRRDEVYIGNIVKCRPPNNRKPEPSETAACAHFITEQIALIQPKAIVALGATAVQGLLGASEGITRLRGRWKLYKNTIPVMPTFHPAYLLRNPSAKRDVWLDLQEVMRHLGKSPIAKE